MLVQKFQYKKKYKKIHFAEMYLFILFFCQYEFYGFLHRDDTYWQDVKKNTFWQNVFCIQNVSNFCYIKISVFATTYLGNFSWCAIYFYVE